MSSWVKYHFNHLKKWREYAEKIAKAVEDIIPDADIYVIGGIAEDRTTIYSDIDILIATPSRILDNEAKKNLVVEVIERAIDRYNLPWDAPIEIHIADAKTLKEYLKTCRKIIPIRRTQVQQETDKASP
uniref:Polymerase nucleotidyl transferase domain-containing protein n=1 Tax=Ignisphaera aggregans TaxID=334771 RepID=A0A7C5TJK2_9CREN